MKKFILTFTSLYMLGFFFMVISLLCNHSLVSQYEWDFEQKATLLIFAGLSFGVFGFTFTALIDEYKK